MIVWFSYVLIGTSLLAAVWCLALGLAGRVPSDFSLGALALVELALITQVVISVIVPIFGNHPTGSLLEFWVYLGSAVLIPPAAGFWALIERNRWSTVVLGIAALAVSVMSYRMTQIWFVQLA